ncbi:hypothetical protein PsYK624_081990 [Phanerochaete sordida]|uniref:Uncharacterized protein n=1 Tax=Phanerochaete sordida TaxID=48140 RepID=A0A9P3GBX2_9APHY|nr:hypothetical protein PsYK624_081990 [Phanerochaete sordida]
MSEPRHPGMATNDYSPFDIYRRYPEKSPYAYEPPLFNLLPLRSPTAVDTPQLRRAALDIAKRTGINVLDYMYGQYPFLMSDLDLRTIRQNPVPFAEYQPPPPLTKLNLPDDVEFVSQVNEKGNTPIFVVKVGVALRLLKIYPVVRSRRLSDYADSDDSDDEDSDAPTDPMKLFLREKEAYAHLVHAGVCEAGHVPQCYGWVELTAAHVDAIASKAPDLTYCDSLTIKDLQKMVRKGRMPKGILLEYFPDAKTLTYKNATEELGQAACRALSAIHAAYVLHGDISDRNLLIIPNGRVVWVDFNSAQCASDPKLTRLDLISEFHMGWDKFYMELLPNRRIGWHGHLEQRGTKAA